MAGEIIAGLSAAKRAFDIARGLKDISDATQRNEAIIGLQQVILDAQQAQTVLLEQVAELRRQLTTLQSEKDERARYELVDVRGDQRFAYRLKSEAANGEPIHLACPVCFKKGKISILHFRTRARGQDWYDCKSCENQMQFGERIREEPSRVKPSYF
jgi:hypothetical protein